MLGPFASKTSAIFHKMRSSALASEPPEWVEDHLAPESLQVSNARVSVAEPPFGIGGENTSWLIGPAYVESIDQILESASCLSSFGARFIRARAYWPDAKVSDFQRHLHSGLKILRSAADHFELKVVSEITSRQDLALLDRYCDVIEVPPELSTDTGLLHELGQQPRVILLNRHPMMSVERFLSALEILEKGGRARILIAENGMRSFDAYTANLLDLSSLIQLRRERPHPILVNCSELADRPDTIEALAVAAIAGGADGVLAELNVEPRRKRPQALSREQLEGVIQRTRALKYTLNALARHKHTPEF